MSGATTEVRRVPLASLFVDKLNVRSIERDADERLVASIRAHGVIQPLIVRQSGDKYAVVEGGRRLDALKKLANGNAGEVSVPVIVRKYDDAEARETSLTANINRQAMHPVDEYRAFNLLFTSKENPLDVAAIGARFGISEKGVRQRLALGNLDDAILDAWRDGNIDEKAAMAFTLCASKKHQHQMWEGYTKDSKQSRGHWPREWEIRRDLKVEDRSSGRILAFVGREEYEKRGGKVTENLFGDDVILSNPALLTQLRDEKLAALVKQYSEDGWKFVSTTKPSDYYLYKTLDPKVTPTKEEAAKSKQLRATIEKLEKKDGRIDLEDDERDTYETTQAELEQLNETVRMRGFTPQLKAKSGVFITLDPHDGEVSIAFGLVPPEKAKAIAPAAGSAPKKKQPAHLSQALEARLSEQRLEGTKAALKAEKKSGKLANLLAEIIASQISPKNYVMPESVRSSLDKIREAITPAVMNEHQRRAFDGKDYFESCPKTFAIAAIAEAVSPAEAKKLTGKKGVEIAKFAIANVLKTKWLPKELRAPHYDGPRKK